MRLTLRTLLAYLDDTLTPGDAEVLRNKLSESEKAMVLVRRIRAAVANADLPAADPNSVSPVDDANLIAEYLDSTLPPEQIAEMERAVNESDSRLAEAAACHQILAMAIGRSAQVPPELRGRVCDLINHPDRFDGDTNARDAGTSAAATASSSSDGESPSGSNLDAAVTTDPLSATSPPDRFVEPVGRMDSGVSDAPSRLREIGGPGVGPPPVTASRQDPFDNPSGFRLSRALPYLVSLAMIAIIGLGLTMAFRPLLRPSIAGNSISENLIAGNSIAGTTDAPGIGESTTVPTPDDRSMVAVPSASQLGTNDAADVGDAAVDPRVPAVDSQTVAVQPATDSEMNGLDTGDAGLIDDAELGGDADQTGDAVASDGTDAMSNGDSIAKDAVNEASTDADAGVVNEIESDSASGDIGMTDPTQPDDAAIEAATNPIQPAMTNDSSVVPSPSGSDPGGVNPTSMNGATDPETAKRTPEPAPAESPVQLLDSDSLVFTVDGGNMRRITGGPVVMDAPVLVAPTFHATFSLSDQSNVRVVGPSHVRFVESEKGVLVGIDFGRVVVSGTAPATQMAMVLGTHPAMIKLSDADSRVIASVNHRRSPGQDANAATRTEAVSIAAIDGTADVVIDEDSLQFEANNGRMLERQVTVDGPPGNVSTNDWTLARLPEWINPPDPNSRIDLTRRAQTGLLTLWQNDRDFEVFLRESGTFRRSEVASLAARTLLMTGRADLFFGGDGLLDNPQHRTHWPNQFDDLLATINRDARSADLVFGQIRKMDQAQAEPIIELLTGFTNDDLMNGDDARLVEWLESPSMTLRNLAFENLRRITGQTMNYRPETTNETRREPAVKRWQAALRKKTIRYPNGSTAPDPSAITPPPTSTDPDAASDENDTPTSPQGNGSDVDDPGEATKDSDAPTENIDT